MIGGLFAVATGLIIACLIGAVFLRAAIALANKVFKPDPAGFRRSVTSRPGLGDQSQPNFDSLADLELDETPAGSNPFAGSNNPVSKDTSSDTNPYAAPNNYGSPQTKIYPVVKPAILEPNYGTACGICFVQALIATFINFVLAVVGPPALAPFLSLGLGFAVATIVYSLMIPTSFGKAAVVYLFQVLIMLAVALVLGVAIGGIMATLG